MRKPIIGITPQYDYERNRIWITPNYMEAIRTSGGIPVLLPLNFDERDTEIIVNHFDGFLFPGGPDVDPFLFNQETIPEGGVVVPERDSMEMKVFQLAYHLDKPMFGICRGIQIFNIFLGGNIFQDIGAQFSSSTPLGHYQKSGNSVLTHSISIQRDSLLHEILNKDIIKVNSFHHQALKDLAPSLKIAATSPDTLVEAVYDPSRSFLLGVQWHPEHLYHCDMNASKLFDAFVNACI